MGKEEEEDSFKRPGTVPFKWESKPGVPKPYHTSTPNHHRPSAKLTPPPASVCFAPSPDLGSTRSFRSVARLRSDRHRHEPVVVSEECFFSPLLRRWAKKTKKVAHKASPDTRKSMSLRESSNCSSSFSSYRSSPQPVRDQEWARYGLF